MKRTSLSPITRRIQPVSGSSDSISPTDYYTKPWEAPSTAYGVQYPLEHSLGLGITHYTDFNCRNLSGSSCIRPSTLYERSFTQEEYLVKRLRQTNHYTHSVDSAYPPTYPQLQQIIRLQETSFKEGINSLNLKYQAGSRSQNGSVCESSNNSTQPSISRQKQPLTSDSEEATRLARKKKRRVLFSKDQLAELERHFTTNRYLTSTQREELASALKLSQTQVKIWFQNHRYKLKKETPPASSQNASVISNLHLALSQQNAFNDERNPMPAASLQIPPRYNAYESDFPSHPYHNQRNGTPLFHSSSVKTAPINAIPQNPSIHVPLDRMSQNPSTHLIHANYGMDIAVAQSRHVLPYADTSVISTLEPPKTMPPTDYTQQQQHCCNRTFLCS